MPPDNALRLALILFSVGGLFYVSVGSGLFDRDNTSWWSGLPKHKQVIAALAVATTLAQSFL